MVLIPVTVTDPVNRFVTGLERDSFKVFEDRKEQAISAFSSEDAPLSIGVVFDCSGSMGKKLSEKSREAVAQFFKLSNPEDEFFFWCRFNDSGESGSVFHAQTWKRFRTSLALHHNRRGGRRCWTRSILGCTK